MLNDRGPFFYTSSLLAHSCPFKFQWEKTHINNVGDNYKLFHPDTREISIDDDICERLLNKILTHISNVKVLFIKSVFFNKDFTLEDARELGTKDHFKSVETLIISKNANLEYISLLFRNVENFYAREVNYQSCMRTKIQMPKLKYLSLERGNIKMVNNINAPLKELDILLVGGLDKSDGREILNKFVDSIRISANLYKYIDYNRDYKLLQFYNASGGIWEEYYQNAITKINVLDFIAPYNALSKKTIEVLVEKYKNDPNFKMGIYSTDLNIDTYLKFKNINLYDDKYVIFITNDVLRCNFPIYKFTIASKFTNKKIIIEKEYRAPNMIRRRIIEYNPFKSTLSLEISSTEDLIEIFDFMFKIPKINIKWVEISTKGFTLNWGKDRLEGMYPGKTFSIHNAKI